MKIKNNYTSYGIIRYLKNKQQATLMQLKKAGLFFLFLLLWSFDVYAQGCSQCRLVAEQGSELDENSFGSGINSGILYLMIIPYLLILFLLRKKIISFFKAKFSK